MRYIGAVSVFDNGLAEKQLQISFEGDFIYSMNMIDSVNCGCHIEGDKKTQLSLRLGLTIIIQPYQPG